MLIQIIFLYVGISSKHFGHYLFFILICIYNISIGFNIVGLWFQSGFYDYEDKVPITETTFCFTIFILVFEVFCIYVVFQSYKQSKQEFRVNYGFIEGQNQIEENIQNEPDIHENIQGINNLQNNNNGNNNNNNNNEGFVPFQGRGVAVGGN